MPRLRPCAVLLAAVLWGCGDPAGSRRAPELALADLSGRAAALSEHRGKAVLLNFWATWCESCKDELPALEDLHRRLGPRGLVVLGVSLDEDPRAAVPPFAKAHGLTFRMLAGDKRAAADYAVRGLPVTFLVAPDGTIVRRWSGPIDAAAVENDILAVLDRRPS